MVTKFGDNSKPYPAEMRRQLWPLCCGAAILSGFKSINSQSEVNATVKAIEDTMLAVPDHQVYAGETLNPKLTFLTLNESQSKVPAIMDAVAKARFHLFATARPRGGLQHFFVRDDSDSFRLVGDEPIAKTA